MEATILVGLLIFSYENDTNPYTSESPCGYRIEIACRAAESSSPAFRRTLLFYVAPKSRALAVPNNAVLANIFWDYI